MNRRSNIKPLLRAVTVMAAVMVLVSGVTFAALQSQQVVLSGNTITSATADLKISTDGVTYSSAHAGFDFTSVVPGGPDVPAAGYSFYLKNTGSTATVIKMAVSTAPTNLSSVDLTKVSIVVTRVPGGSSQSLTLASLVNGHIDGGVALTDTLAAGVANQHKVQVSMSTDAFTGAGASLGNIDFVFTGTSV